jgi:eukaryotic-like serine/threonine-protein kinase
MGEFTPDRWRRIRSVLEAVLDAPPATRPRLLDELCGDDPELRADVVALLAAEESAPDLIDKPVLEAAGALVSELGLGESEPEAADEMVGRKIGAYRIIRELGRGGMGTVYLAERADGQFEHQVAIKLLHRGLEADDLLRRFLAERQILASLNHPNIARLLDGGATPDGRPFLVMEHVEGRSITEYCDQHRLPIDARLELFTLVGAAVQHAHRNLVVHRDLKPSNILVTGEGQVKLLDFGIAKLLSDDDMPRSAPRTRTGWLLMTPEYASPEQVLGEPMTTASDVYQLGILLYELLVGQRPHRIESLSRAEAERLICHREPPAPSGTVVATPAVGPEAGPAAAEIAARRRTVPERLVKKLRGDLDAIVLKALRKEPEHRYATVESLVDDVGRYRAGLPVRARRGTRRYRARKFGRRHRWPLAAAAILAVLLAGYAGTASVQAGQVRRALDQATLEAEKARQVSDFLIGMFESADPRAAPGEEITAREILSRAVEKAEQLADQPEVQAEMLAVTGRVYRTLGQFERALPLLERSLSLRRGLYGDRHLEVAASMDALATLLQHQGRYDEAEPLFLQALATRQELLGGDHEAVAASMNNLGLLLTLRGDYEAAEPLYRAALTILRGRPDADPDRLATYLNNLAGLFRHTGDPGSAEPLYREALSLKLEAHGTLHPSTALGTSNLANLLMEAGSYEEAGRLHEEALAAYRVLFGDEHPDVSVSLYSIGVLRLRQGALDAAEAAFRRVLELDRKLLGPHHPDLAYGLIGLARVHLERGEAWLAQPLLEEAVNTHLAGLPDEQWLVADAKGWLGESLLAQDLYDEAEPLLQSSHASFAATRGTADPRTRRTVERLVDLYEALDRPEQAARYRALLVASAPSTSSIAKP